MGDPTGNGDDKVPGTEAEGTEDLELEENDVEEVIIEDENEPDSGAFPSYFRKTSRVNKSTQVHASDNNATKVMERTT